MEKGRSRLPVTADAYGLANPETRRSLDSRPPYRTNEMLPFLNQSVCLRDDFLKPAAGDDRAPTVHGDGVRDGLNGELPEEVAPGPHPLPGGDVDTDRVAEVEFF